MGGFSSFSQDTIVYLSKPKEVVKILQYNMRKIVFSTYPLSDVRNEIQASEVEYIKFKNGKLFRYNNSLPSSSQNEQTTEVPIITTTINSTHNSQDTTERATMYDLIIFKTGEEIESKIILVSENEVIYKKFNFLDGPQFSVNKSNLFMIKYSNGQKDIFSKEVSTQKTYSNSNFGEATKQGETDAIANYKTGGAFAAGLSTFILTPVLALIPTAIITSIEPNDSNLKYPNVELYNTNPNYKAAYKKQAFKMKKKAVWGGYAMGAVINIGVGLILLTQ